MRRLLLVLASATACVPAPPAKSYEDPPPVDAGFVAAPADAGTKADAGFVTPDAGFPDAGFPDAGFRDGGFRDGGFPDGGLPGVPLARGPSSGVVIVHGGGGTARGREGLFYDYVGDRDAPVVVVPTAQGSVSISGARSQLTNVGFSNVTVLHTRDPSEADTAAFVEPLTTAAGVWFSGGRQWRLADAYLGTRFMDELTGVLDRGGVIGGTSAGASIMGSFLVRGDTSGNTIVIGDHIVGFGYLENTGVDQHVAQRGRQTDLFEVVDRYPDILGVGLDEPIAAVFTADSFEVVGSGLAYVHYRALWDFADTREDRYMRLPPGTVFDLRTLTTR